MQDIAVSYNKYQFLGNEFLTWLWFILDNKPDIIHKADREVTAFEIGNRVAFENRVEKRTEVITIKGDDAGLEEGLLSLQKGAIVVELNLSCTIGNEKWQFTLKGESLSMSSLKVPVKSVVETREDIEGAVLDKIFLCEKVIVLVDRLFHQFIKLRISNEWANNIVPEMKKWVHA
jgi:hypothetical protein